MTDIKDLVIVEDYHVIRLEDGSTIPIISPETEIREVDGKHVVFYNGKYHCDLGRKKVLEEHWCHSEPGYNVGRCRMITRSGERCKMGCREGWSVCYKHGAGHKSNPGGYSNWHLDNSYFGASLPDHLVDRYMEFVNNPDIISVRSHIGLLDTRIDECIERLKTTNADTEVAWTKVKLAAKRLDNILDEDSEELDLDDLIRISDTLFEAIEAQQNDSELWSEIVTLTEQRRKMSDTERRRIVDSKAMLTIEEANMFLAYVLASIQRHVSSVAERRAIADDMQRFVK